jgi:hypothetical protein
MEGGTGSELTLQLSLRWVKFCRQSKEGLPGRGNTGTKGGDVFGTAGEERLSPGHTQELGGMG